MRALIIALCLLATPALADVAGVASVIDGDTLEIHGQRIRLHGIDAGEPPALPPGRQALAVWEGCGKCACRQDRPPARDVRRPGP